MESTPLVSVVTPFYNTRDYLAECIESVLRQTYTNWEYILVDNFSTDGSSEIAKHYADKYPDKIRLIHSLSTMGFSRIEVSSFVSPKAIPPARASLRRRASGPGRRRSTAKHPWLGWKPTACLRFPAIAGSRSAL